MRRLPRVSRRFLVVRLTLLSIVLSVAMPPVSASAQYYDVHSNAPFEQLTGLQFAGQRLYQGTNELNIYLDIAVFDTADHARAGLTALNAYYLTSYQIAGTPIRFDPVAPPDTIAAALSYHALLDVDGNPYANIAFVQLQDESTVLTAFVSNYAYDSNPVELAMEVAVAMLESILAVPVATATPAAIDPDSIMARLPLETDKVPAGFGMTYSEDTDWFQPEATGEPTVASAETDPSQLIYGDAEGLETVIGRTYELASEDEILNAYIEIAAFAGDDQAETGYANAETALLEEIVSQELAFDEVEIDIPADSARAWSGTTGESEEFVVIVVTHSGNHVVTVAVGASDADTARDVAGDLVRETIEAEPGGGEPQHDQFGSSTGGLWEMLPGFGDEVLRGMEPYWDEEIYP